MPEVDIYLPDDLYRAALEAGLPLSALIQQAIERALGDDEPPERVTSTN